MTNFYILSRKEAGSSKFFELLNYQLLSSFEFTELQCHTVVETLFLKLD